jgi:hypothetical protein
LRRPAGDRRARLQCPIGNRIRSIDPYKVTFTLPGFSTFVREGVELEAEFTASINAQLRVGALQETVTVSGAIRFWQASQ